MNCPVFHSSPIWPTALFYDTCLTLVAFKFVNPSRDIREHEETVTNDIYTASGELRKKETERDWKRYCVSQSICPQMYTWNHFFPREAKFIAEHTHWILTAYGVLCFSTRSQILAKLMQTFVSTAQTGFNFY